MAFRGHPPGCVNDEILAQAIDGQGITLYLPAEFFRNPRIIELCCFLLQTMQLFLKTVFYAFSLCRLAADVPGIQLRAVGKFLLALDHCCRKGKAGGRVTGMVTN